MAKPPESSHALRIALDHIEFDLFAGSPPTAMEVRERLDPFLTATPSREQQHRVDQLLRLFRGGSRADYLEMHGASGVRRFTTEGGATIYGMSIETYPRHINNVYMVREGKRLTLFDCGSDSESSRQDLRRAAVVLRRVYGESAGLDEVDDLVISHAHVDHFAGLAAWAGAVRVHVHEFDARAVTHYEERIAATAPQKRVLLERSGLNPASCGELERMYMQTRALASSASVDRLLADGASMNGNLVHHTPGHCAGQICLQVHDVLLSSDHVLPTITPHLSAESITPWTGLDHFLLSLRRVRQLRGITLALPGHEEPFSELGRRVAAIEEFHRDRLSRVLKTCRMPRSLVEIAEKLFGPAERMRLLLALEETAAHVEYLLRRGQLEVVGTDELTRSLNPVLRYRTAADAPTTPETPCAPSGGGS